MRTYGFNPHHMTAQTSPLHGFTKVIKFIAQKKKLLCKYCLYVDYYDTFQKSQAIARNLNLSSQPIKSASLATQYKVSH